MMMLTVMLVLNYGTIANVGVVTVGEPCPNVVTLAMVSVRFKFVWFRELLPV